jgi:MFS family permease
MGMSLSTSFLPILAHNLDPSGALVGLTVSAFFLSRLFIELPAGILSDRVGRWKLLVTGIGLSAFSAFLCSQASNIYILIIGRAIWGLGTALFFMNNTALVIDLFDSKTRGHALGIFQGVEFIGSFLGSPLGALIAGLIGYRRVFYVSLAMVSCSLTIALTSRGLRSAGGGRRGNNQSSLSQALPYLKNFGVLAICMGSFLRMLVMQGIFATIFELYLGEEIMVPITYIGLVMSLRTVGHIVATTSSGFISDKFGRKRTVMTGFLVESLCLASFTVISSVEMFLLIGFIDGFGEGLVFTGLIVLLSDMVPSSTRGMAIGIYRTFMDVGGFIGPLILMAVYLGTGSHVAFLLSAALCVLCTSILAFTKLKPVSYL